MKISNFLFNIIVYKNSFSSYHWFHMTHPGVGYSMGMTSHNT